MKFNNGLPLVDRVMLIETFLYWSANHAFRLLAIVAPALYLLFGLVTVDSRATDAISHVFPFVAALVAVNLWLMEWRVLPIVADMYQLLCATEILKAVAVGLLRPKGQKFKVTAKGGDRSRRFVQWPILRNFLFLLALNVGGIVNAFFLHQGQAVDDCGAVALFWCWYNIIVLSIACFVCVEQPRRTDGARFPTSEPVVVRSGQGVAACAAFDISVGGIKLLGETPLAVGAQAELGFAGMTVSARLVRIDGDGFAFAFDPARANRVRMIRHVHSGRYSVAVRTIRPGSVARRDFRPDARRAAGRSGERTRCAGAVNPKW